MRVLLSEKAASETVGIIFPLLPKHAERLLNEGKTVFVKFFGRESIPLRLRQGSKLFLYESQGNKAIVGEASITRVESVRASDAVSTYGARLFLTQLEFDEYVGNRGDKTMLALVLGEVRKYAVPLSLERSVTMAGRYMTREMHKRLLRQPRNSITINAESRN
jgi:hypothetical protein